MKNELHDLLALQLLQFHRPSSYNWQKYQDARKAFEQRLDAAESRIAELVSGIKEAQIELIETGNCYEILEKLIEGE